MTERQNQTYVLPLPDGSENQNPKDISFFSLIKEDFNTHDRSLTEPGFWAVAVHRFGNWRMGVKFKIFRFPFTLLYRLLFTWVHWVWGIKLSYPVKLGRRVRIWHHGGMVLGAREIGNDVHIRQNTTFGLARRGENMCKPIIEDRVDIGCGVCILGNIRISHDSIIGANAVVLKDVPKFSLVGGVPAKVIKTIEPDEEKTSENKTKIS